MYKHEIQSSIDAGKKVRRGSWPKGSYMVKLPAGPIDLSDKELEAAGLNPSADVTTAEVNVFCESKKKATYGYELTHEDNNSQDWEDAE